MTMLEKHHSDVSLLDKLANRPDLITARVMMPFDLSGVDLNIKGTSKKGSINVVTSIVDLPEHRKRIINVAYEDGKVLEVGKLKGRLKPISTYERTFANDKVVLLRYAYPDKDSHGNYYTVQLLQEFTEEANGQYRQVLPGNISILR